MSLQIQNLHVSVEDKSIVKGLNLQIKPGEVHAIMGPNGSGKSTLANTLLGHPKYTITHGKILVDATDVPEMSTDEKAKHGLFLSMQYPPEIEGVTITNFLRLAYNALKGTAVNPLEFHRKLVEKMKTFGVDPSFATRYVNTGFSGGEKKRAEILQLAVLEPTYAVLDETDSGLDVDAIKTVANVINSMLNGKKSILMITHYDRLLELIKPDFVHILSDGKIAKTGDYSLALELDEKGFEALGINNANS